MRIAVSVYNSGVSVIYISPQIALYEHSHFVAGHSAIASNLFLENKSGR